MAERRQPCFPDFSWRIRRGFLLTIEDLDDAHARDVFLQEGIDSGDGVRMWRLASRT